ncbi:LysM peptidoglycan-binding domain-containing protein [Mastigocoleus sp. MO_188.B34]|uniref:CIS tube protein n=1 Tax=Mastigocoleus sp. MO_188.B34 TaxID=3036635 RepID=UPI00260457D8|nr:LysM peptidoglycan-binding domain-containing protein [Mastigocoleus sp. MO_188.B34]MDJ0694561.1 LysM peptidoglycan-binding domain-containing protein [Mastigocoleus sp. MO_188.B34]
MTNAAKTGELTKVKLEVYKDDRYQNKIGYFDLPINPEQFSQQFQIEYNRSQANGAQHNDPEYKYTRPQELKLDFIFDGTGVVPDKQNPGKFHRDVVSQLQEFFQLTYTMNPETHKPNFLRLLWGDFSFGYGRKNGFNCILTNLQVNYTLFASDGKPLRAKLSATFTSYTEQKLRLLEENKKSPDLTHQRKVKAGDTLPLMTYRTYDDSSYYLQIAKVNGLINFRRLATNTDLRFPPLEKTEL